MKLIIYLRVDDVNLTFVVRPLRLSLRVFLESGPFFEPCGVNNFNNLPHPERHHQQAERREGECPRPMLPKET